MHIQHTQNSNIPQIVVIYNQAKEYLKSKGINQWQDGYPNEDSIREDIAYNQSYILINNDTIIGTAAIVLDKDTNYDYIEDGQWLTNTENYYCIHRIAVDNTYKGQNLAKHFLDYAETLAKQDSKSSLRIDTHHENLSMQRFLIKNGFQPCGTIYLQNKDKRLAFEKLL